MSLTEGVLARVMRGDDVGEFTVQVFTWSRSIFQHFLSYLVIIKIADLQLFSWSLKSVRNLKNLRQRYVILNIHKPSLGVPHKIDIVFLNKV